MIMDEKIASTTENTSKKETPAPQKKPPTPAELAEKKRKEAERKRFKQQYFAYYDDIKNPGDGPNDW